LKRISALQATLKQKNDYFAIFNSTNITYLTGFPGATALLIPQTGQCTLLVSEVNFEQAKTETHDFDVQLQLRGENLMERIGKQTCQNKLAVDSLSIEGWRALAKAVGGEEKLQLAGELVRSSRLVKDEDEVKRIREACNLAEIGMQTAAENIKQGVTERRIAAEVEYAMRKKGSDGTSFDTIVASGPNGAYPHGSCANRVIRQGDLVIVDLGATYQFYRSDMTRTFVVGRPTEKQIKIYETVKVAQQRAFKAMAPNIAAARVDAVARQVIEAAGFGEFFVHGLGHGLGLEIHEPPTLSSSSKDFLAAGNVVTVEPGIYLPGYGGVRIEDTVLVTERGAEKLTSGMYTLVPNL
jgi:Xaa-Pro aminopeptidase